MLKDWRKGLIAKIPKKGDIANCNNWRGITLLSVPSKILARIILNSIQVKIEARIRREQVGFRVNRSCTDQICTLRIIIEQCIEWNNRLYAIFVDFEKAFDSVKSENMWLLLKKCGIADKITNIITESYRQYNSQVIHAGELTEPSETRTAVRQGCILSPFLFLLVTDTVMRNTIKGKKRRIQWSLMERLIDLDFADDVCLLTGSYKDAQTELEDLRKEAQKYGLILNKSKTKTMHLNTKKQNPIFLENIALEDVNGFTYLGSIVTKHGRSG